MVTKISPRVRWQGLAYNISLTGFILVIIFGCQVFYPVLKNYQDSELPNDQIAIIYRAWLIDGVWELKADQEKFLLYEYKENTFSDNSNRVRQFKLKPGNYEIFIQDNPRGDTLTIPFRELFRVQLKAGHDYRVDWSYDMHWLEHYYVQHYWIEDLTTGEVVGGRKP